MQDVYFTKQKDVLCIASISCKTNDTFPIEQNNEDLRASHTRKPSKLLIASITAVSIYVSSVFIFTLIQKHKSLLSVVFLTAAEF